MSNTILPSDYQQTLSQVINLINTARFESLKALDKEKVKLYLNLGQTIFEKTENAGWGSFVVTNLSKDLKNQYIGVRGFSERNLWDMKRYYTEIKDSEKLRTLSAEIDFSSGLTIISKVKSEEERLYYFNLAKKGRSVRDIERKIKNNEYNKTKELQSNFEQTIDKERVDLAVEEFKDSYNFDLLELSDGHRERELENAIVTNIEHVLNEFGSYFTFAGRQIILEQGGDQFRIDLLFYHRILKSLVVVELKAGEFKPEYAGKMQFYLNLVDEQLKSEGENPAIGLIICKDKNRTRVEYTLKDLNRPVGVATYTYQELPEKLAKYLPSESDLEDITKDIE